MRKQKKQLAVLLTLAMVLQLAACSRAPAPSAPETSLSQTETSGAETEETTEAGTDGDALPAAGEEISGFTLKAVEP